MQPDNTMQTLVCVVDVYKRQHPYKERPVAPATGRFVWHGKQKQGGRFGRNGGWFPNRHMHFCEKSAII